MYEEKPSTKILRLVASIRNSLDRIEHGHAASFHEIKRLEREQRMEYRRFDTHLTAIRNASRSSANRKKKKTKKKISNNNGPLQTQSRRLKELEVCSFGQSLSL